MSKSIFCRSVTAIVFIFVSKMKSKLEEFLRFNGREVLDDFGRVQRNVAEALALEVYEKYDAHRRCLEKADVDALTDEVSRIKP